MEMLSRRCGNVVLLFLHTVRTFPSNHQTSSCSRDKLHSHVDEKRVRERVQARCSDFGGQRSSAPVIDVRQIAASVKVRELCDELLFEEL